MRCFPDICHRGLFLPSNLGITNTEERAREQNSRRSHQLGQVMQSCVQHQQSRYVISRTVTAHTLFCCTGQPLFSTPSSCPPSQPLCPTRRTPRTTTSALCRSASIQASILCASTLTLSPPHPHLRSSHPPNSLRLHLLGLFSPPPLHHLPPPLHPPPSRPQELPAGSGKRSGTCSWSKW
jgi:hypothetical protein